MLPGQPKVNHRNLCLQDVKDRLIPAALQIKGGEGMGFEEQTYAIVYEIADLDDERTKDIPGVPIYSTYVTEHSGDPMQIESVKAIFPTREAMLELCQLIQAQELIDKYSLDQDNSIEGNDTTLTTQQLFREILDHKIFSTMKYGTNLFPNIEQLQLTRSNKTANQQYRGHKILFQHATSIRIAMIGGLHRTATACHLYAGITPTPNSTLAVPRVHPKDTTYQIKNNMVLNASTALTIFVPKKQKYTHNYIKQISAYSYRIDKRKTFTLSATERSVTLLILDHERHDDFPDVTDRFIAYDVEVFTTQGKEVCTRHFIHSLWFLHEF